MAVLLRLDVGYLTQLSVSRNSAPFGNGAVSNADIYADVWRYNSGTGAPGEMRFTAW